MGSVCGPTKGVDPADNTQIIPGIHPKSKKKT